jgi:hypothetical protein
MKQSLIATIVGALVAAPFAVLVAQPVGTGTPGTGSGTGSESDTDGSASGGSGSNDVTDGSMIGSGGDTGAGDGGDGGDDEGGDTGEPNIADDLGVAPEIFTARLYGFIDARFEKSEAQPALDDAGNTIGEKQAAEFDIPGFNVMLQGRIYGRYRYYLNLTAPGSGSPTEDSTIDLRNAWVEFPIYRDFFNFRVGKTYRRFGLYNEILDAVPTYIGIEPPEMFDKDHLMLTRTTNAMLNGTIVSGSTALSYAMMTGNDERAGAQLPFGADLRFDFADQLELGGSYYSSNGNAGPTTDVGGGVPKGGVAQWMEKDQFQVYALFAQLTAGGVTAQAEFTRAHHEAVRDPGRTFALILDDDGNPTNPNGLIPNQLRRFGLDGATPTEDDVVTDVTYNVTAIYGRVGYEFKIPYGWTLTPYAQIDYYINPEIINEKDFGGDNEAGLSDDGKIYKYTLGVVARPVRFVAIKLDGSAHGANFNGGYYNYNEVRASFSMYWELGDAD